MPSGAQGDTGAGGEPILSEEEQRSRRKLVAELMTQTPNVAGLGVVIERHEPDDVVVRLPFREDLTNDGERHHGGAVAAVVDTAGAEATWSGHDFTRGIRASTVSLALQFVRACTRSDLVCTARTVRRPRELVFVDITATDERGGSSRTPCRPTASPDTGRTARRPPVSPPGLARGHAGLIPDNAPGRDVGPYRPTARRQTMRGAGDASGEGRSKGSEVPPSCDARPSIGS